ncbi:MAG: HNH endonuclease, partial [Candidatus Poribacteria bacterium]
RVEAISLHGTKCMACDFDFEKKYGERGKGFIEIHHIKPVSELGGNTKVDPATDLVVVCSNCHRMIHRKKNKVLSLEELKKIIQ